MKHSLLLAALLAVALAGCGKKEDASNSVETRHCRLIFRRISPSSLDYTEGLFRVPGNNDTIQKLRLQFEKRKS